LFVRRCGGGNIPSILEVIPENDLREAILAEYKKRLILYKLTDERFKKNME